MKKFLKKVILLSLFAGITASVFAKPISSQRQDLIDAALVLMGTPYYWGGKTPEPGIDCSGFVSFTSRKGIKVNFTGNAQSMFNASSAVSRAEREPGDLLFFSESNSTRNITHVGIYLGKYTGPGKFHNKHLFIHSASGGSNTGVIVSSIDDKSYWTQHYMGCRRYLPSSALATKAVKAQGAKSIQSSSNEFSEDDYWDDVDVEKWFDE
ncbi:MAG: C40 family peptidase [Treponema sp.]|nr:C40 family peptidase [Treponema sp.]